MFKEVDIIEELAREREKFKSGEDSLLSQAEKIILNSADSEKDIFNRLSGKSQQSESDFTLEKLSRLDGELIFDKRIIENICTKYRLRFLDSKLFAGDIPYEAQLKIKKIENQIDHRFSSFKILAPESRFKLKDSTEDPILFVALGNGEYYMIHKWGDDMGWYRNVINFPLRNITTLAITSVSIALVISLFIPQSFFPNSTLSSTFALGLAKLYTSFILSGLIFVTVLIVGILRSKEFSQDVWNSKYFN
tara:strand:- start:2714 stop:3460 length:747 start_codon:yes stop_codon:yes gene_type:complete